MIERRPRFPSIEMGPREELCNLPLPPRQRAVLVAIYDLAGGGLEWCGTRKQLGDQMGCDGATANRRARSVEQHGFLHVETTSKGGRYRLLCLQPAASTSAPSALLDALRKFQLSTACVVVSRLLHIVVASCINPAYGVATAVAIAAECYAVRAEQRRTAERTAGQIGVSVPRPLKPARNQLELKGFAEACAPAAPPEAPGAQPGAPSAPPVIDRGAPPAESPGILDADAVPCGTPPPTIPIQSTDPSSQRLLESTPGIGRRTGHQNVWWKKSIERSDLRSPAGVQELYLQATAAGAWLAAEMPRQQFFAFAHYCSRAKVDSPGALFVKHLGKSDTYGKPFAKRYADKDRDWAAGAIKAVDLGPRDAPRSADLLNDAPPIIPPPPARQRKRSPGGPTFVADDAAAIAALQVKYPNLSPRNGVPC